MLKKQRCSRMESLHHDVVEHIQERVPVKSLLKFKSKSKKWKSTIETRLFQERQLMQRQQLGDPDVLTASILHYEYVFGEPDIGWSLRTLVLGLSSSVKTPTSLEDTYYFVCHSSCDGLVCLYYHAVRFGSGSWQHRFLPRSNQNLKKIFKQTEPTKIIVKMILLKKASHI